MNKQEFLAELRKGLSGLPQEDIEERLPFYSEMIDDRMEEGLTEAEAVDAIGPVHAVVAQILEDTPFKTLVKEKVRSNRVWKAWEIVLLVLGSPIWVSLLIAALAVVFSAYVVLWSLVVALWSVGAALAACSVGGIVAAVALAIHGNLFMELAMLGAGICCAGLSILLFLCCKAATKGTLWLTKELALAIKGLFVGKEGKV